MKENVIKVRFPNDSHYDEAPTFILEDFRLIHTYQSEVFGVWNDVPIFIKKGTYDKLFSDETKG